MPPDLSERLLRGLYSTLLVVLAPVTVYHLIWRGFRQPAYFQRWNERYARYGRTHTVPAQGEVLWVHAVSVGEVAAATGLVMRLGLTGAAFLGAVAAVLLTLVLFFVGSCLFALRPGSRPLHRDAAESIFRNETRPADPGQKEAE